MDTVTPTLTQKQTNKQNVQQHNLFYSTMWWKKTSNTQLQARNRCELSSAWVLDKPPNMFLYIWDVRITAIQEMVNNTKIITDKDIGQDLNEGNGSPVNNKQKRKKAFNDQDWQQDLLVTPKWNHY